MGGGDGSVAKAGGTGSKFTMPSCAITYRHWEHGGVDYLEPLTCVQMRGDMYVRAREKRQTELHLPALFHSSAPSSVRGSV